MTTAEVYDAIMLKPGPVQVLLKAFMVKRAVETGAADDAKYGAEALEWWNKIDIKRATVELDPGAKRPTEIEFAEMAVRCLRQHPLWGRLLRGNAS